MAVGVALHARVSANHSAAATTLNINGLSHGKTAKFYGDMLKTGSSCSWLCRNKISAARRLKPEYDTTRRDLLNEAYMQCESDVVETTKVQQWQNHGSPREPPLPSSDDVVGH